MDVEDDGEAEEDEEEEMVPHVGTDEEELNYSAENPKDGVHAGSAEPTDKAEEQDSSLHA